MDEIVMVPSMLTDMILSVLRGPMIERMTIAPIRMRKTISAPPYRY